MKIKLTALFVAIIAVIVWVVHIPKDHPQSTLQNDAQRIITTDWTIAETLIALDAPLIGIGDKAEYQVWVTQPALPDSVADLGLRSQPNLEVIANLKPTIHISSVWSQSLIPSNIMPIKSAPIDFYTQEGMSWQSAVATTQQLAKIVARTEQAKALIASTQQRFQQDSKQLAAYQGKPFAMVQFIDARQLRIYGQNSLYGSVLTQLNLTNAWPKSENAWGSDQISLLDLAKLPQGTMLIIVKPYPTSIYEQLKKNSLWQSLPFSDGNHYRILPAVWAFGALPSMQRFSDVLTHALTTPPNPDAENDW